MTMSPEHLFTAIKKNRFVMFGRAGMDMFADPAGTRSEDAEWFRADLGGSSANVCVGLCKLGAQAALVTSVSDDAVGRFCRNRLQHYGVETTYVKDVGGECRTSLAVYESRLENYQSVIYRNNASDFEVTPEDVDRVDFSRFGASMAAGTVLSAEPSRASTFRAMAKAGAQGLPVIFDIDYRPYSWPSAQEASQVLTRAGNASDVIVGNDEEFDFMAGAEGAGMAKAQDFAAQGKLVIYKKGPEGAITFWQGEEIPTGIYKVDALKPVGAGDAFLSGLMASLAAGHALRDAILRGSACASITVSRPGCAPAMPDLAELDAFITDHPGPS